MKKIIIAILFCFKIFGDFSWNLPSKAISSADDNISPQVKMDNYGNVICMWINSSRDLERSISDDYGVSWSSPMKVQENVVKFLFDMNDSGQAVLINNTIYSIVTFLYSTDYGRNWSLSSSVSTIRGMYSISLDKYGKALAVLLLSDELQPFINWLNTYGSVDGGRNWDIEDTIYGDYLVASALNDNNQAILVYKSLLATTLFRKYITWSEDSGWNFSSQSVIGGMSYLRDLKINDSGFVVCTGCIGGIYIITGEVHSTDGGINFSSVHYLSELDKYVTIGSQKVVLDANGYASVIWQIFDGVNYRIQESHTVDYGNSWSTPYYLSEAGQDSNDAVISSDKKGNTFVSWYRYDGSNDIRQVRWSFDRATSWSDVLDISSLGQEAKEGDITMDQTGHVVVAFILNNGSKDLVNVVTGGWQPFYSNKRYIGIKTRLVKKNIDFFLTRELICNLKWKNIPFAYKYNLYKDRDLTILIGSTTKLQYSIHNTKIDDRYFFTWEDYVGEQRDKTRIFVK